MIIRYGAGSTLGGAAIFLPCVVLFFAPFEYFRGLNSLNLIVWKTIYLWLLLYGAVLARKGLLRSPKIIVDAQGFSVFYLTMSRTFSWANVASVRILKDRRSSGRQIYRKLILSGRENNKQYLTSAAFNPERWDLPPGEWFELLASKRPDVFTPELRKELVRLGCANLPYDDVIVNPPHTEITPEGNMRTVVDPRGWTGTDEF